MYCIPYCLTLIFAGTDAFQFGAKHTHSQRRAQQPPRLIYGTLGLLNSLKRKLNWVIVIVVVQMKKRGKNNNTFHGVFFCQHFSSSSSLDAVLSTPKFACAICAKSDERQFFSSVFRQSGFLRDRKKTFLFRSASKNQVLKGDFSSELIWINSTRFKNTVCIQLRHSHLDHSGG